MATKNTKSNAEAGNSNNRNAHIMVTLPITTRKKIEALAAKEERPMAYLCRQFIEQGLNALKKQAAK